jgi:hypothetical protein
MSTVDLAEGRWRLHRRLGQVITPNEMGTPSANGTNTDVLLRFEVQQLGLGDPAPFALQGTWYKGGIEMLDPRHDPWDTPEGLGTFWAKVFPATNLTRHSVQIIQELFPAPGNTNTTGEKLVRMYTGRYFVNELRFFGYGADNWASELFTFTLTHEAWPS